MGDMMGILSVDWMAVLKVASKAEMLDYPRVEKLVGTLADMKVALKADWKGKQMVARMVEL